MFFKVRGSSVRYLCNMKWRGSRGKAQSVERLTAEREVAGSIPGAGT